MKKILLVLIATLTTIVVSSGSLSILSYAKEEETCCTCNQDPLTLSEAIKCEMKDVFSSEAGFAAATGGIVSNLPPSPGTNLVSSNDITLTEGTPGTPSSPSTPGIPPGIPVGGIQQPLGDLIGGPSEIPGPTPIPGPQLQGDVFGHGSGSGGNPPPTPIGGPGPAGNLFGPQETPGPTPIEGEVISANNIGD
jgi:hypothetical protein